MTTTCAECGRQYIPGAGMHDCDLARGRSVLGLVAQERERQDRKWGEQNHPLLFWLAILGEEVGEVNKAVLEDTGVEHVKEELIQVAAVAVAMVECIERNDLKRPMETPRILLTAEEARKEAS